MDEMGMKRVTRGGIYKQESAGAGRKGTKVVGPVGRDRSQVNTLSALSLSRLDVRMRCTCSGG
jgi:hypothetical protein